ncbi:MAG TPA: MarR family winged helix-turn-helix transcriptional regulator [Stellaceae bacterium]|nr:MarR family winged helix-turn-helix transcriptional regulator [Stellaceae bacterium]
MAASDAVRVARPNWPEESEPQGRRVTPAELQVGVGYRLHAVGRLLRRRFERSVRQAGLPITRLQAALLLYIARNPGVGQTAAASDLDLEPIALVRMLDRLHEEGLIERRAHPTDRRVRTLWLTPLGWPVVKRIIKINLAVRAEACAGLSPEAVRALMDTLSHMKDNLDAAEADAGEPIAQLATGEGE